MNINNNQNRPAPPRSIRLLCWFGIYIAAPFPLIPWMYHVDWRLWLLFPMGIGWGLMGLVSEVIPKGILEMGGNQLAEDILRFFSGFVVFILPWVTYLAHFIWTLCVQKRRSFLVLIWILILIVLLNIAGCAYCLHAPPE